MLSHNFNRCTVVQLFRYTIVPSYRCSVIPLFRYTIVPLFRCSVIPLFRCSVVPLFRYSVVSLFHCAVPPLWCWMTGRFIFLFDFCIWLYQAGIDHAPERPYISCLKRSIPVEKSVPSWTIPDLFRIPCSGYGGVGGAPRLILAFPKWCCDSIVTECGRSSVEIYYPILVWCVDMMDCLHGNGTNIGLCCSEHWKDLCVSESWEVLGSGGG